MGGGRSRVLFFYSLLWVRSGGVERGSFDGLASVNDGEKQIPLSIILAKGSTGEIASEGEKTMVGEGVGVSLRVAIGFGRKRQSMG